MFCIVRQQEKVFASTMLNASSTFFSRHDKQAKKKAELQFEIDKIFDNLDPDFKIVVQFYFCNLSATQQLNYRNDHNSSNHSLICKIFSQLKKTFKYAKHFKDSVFDKEKSSFSSENEETQVWLNNSKTLNLLNFADCDDIDLVPIVGSSFKHFGTVTVHRGNCTDSQFSIEQFDYFLSPSEPDQVRLQLEPSIDFGQAVVYSLGVHVEHLTIGNHDKPIKIAKFKFVKRSVEIDGKHLKVWSSSFKRGHDQINQDKFDLGCCLNSANIEESTVQGLDDTICFLFTCEPPDEYDGGRYGSSRHSKDASSQLYKL